MTSEPDVDLVLNAILCNSIQVRPIADYGWPNQIELAVVDAVLSIRARYGSRKLASSTGVIGRVEAYRESFGSDLDDLSVLVGRDRDQLQNLLGRQKGSGVLKVDLIQQVATNLLSVDVRHARNLNPKDARQKHAWTCCHGLGAVTWEYFGMLLGQSGVKADTMIRRFVASAVSTDEVDSRRAAAAIRGAANALQTEPHLLDHAIWAFQRLR